MSTLMSDEVVQKARELSVIRGFDNPNDYLMNLIELDQAESDSFEGMETELEQLLIEGVNSGPGIPATPEYWNNLKSRLATL